MALRKKVRPLPICNKLRNEQSIDPMLVIYELFDFAKPEQVKEILWNWLKSTVTSNFSEELCTEEKTAILLLYEKLVKLIEAAAILNQPKNQKRIKTGQQKLT